MYNSNQAATSVPSTQYCRYQTCLRTIDADLTTLVNDVRFRKVTHQLRFSPNLRRGRNCGGLRLICRRPDNEMANRLSPIKLYIKIFFLMGHMSVFKILVDGKLHQLEEYAMSGGVVIVGVATPKKPRFGPEQPWKCPTLRPTRPCCCPSSLLATIRP